MKIVSMVFVSSLLIGLFSLSGCGLMSKTDQNVESETEQIKVNTNSSGDQLNFKLVPGDHHNHPSFAIWAETLNGTFIQTLFVTKSIGTGFFGHGSIGDEQWAEGAGPQSRPAALPYWLHKRIPQNRDFELPTPENPVPDAYTGATPAGDAKIMLKSDQQLPDKFKLMLEVNQPWDWNAYWHNTKYDNADYRTSCQPALIYYVEIDKQAESNTYYMNPIGHSHPYGESGDIFTEINTLTTAKDIYRLIEVTIPQN